VSQSISARDFIRIGRGCAEKVIERLEGTGAHLRTGSRVLDFGCGCDRTIAWLMERFPDVEFHGVDVDSEAIEWCARHFRTGQFLATQESPPLPFPEGYFDVIYCISVFTHLNEKMQDEWIAELRRILRAGGVLVFTVHGQNATSGLTPEDLNALETAGFVHKKSRKLHGIVPEWYHTTWHSRAYVMKHFTQWFDEISYFEVPDGLQDFVTAR
jgi:cyclopropane fatty-acyl-phospholipid synthase-like methyltransferase